MDYKGLKKDIASNQLKSVYLFTGEEEYLMDFYVEEIKNRFIKPEMEALNYVEIEGKDKGFEDILNACETLPFMADKKIVYVKDLLEFLDGSKDFSQRLTDYVSNLDNFVVLILKDKNNKLRRNTKLFKAIDKLNGVIDFKKLNPGELTSWIKAYIESYNKDISNRDLSYLIKKTGYTEYRSEKTLQDVSVELNKIINHSDEDFISQEDIDSNFIKTLDTNIFNLLDSINRKDSQNSLRIFNEMYRANEPMGRILYMITRQLRLILKYKIFKNMGYNDLEVRNKLEIKPYEYKKISSSSRAYKEEELKCHLIYLLDMDKKQKTSSYNEKLAIEMLIVRLTK